MNTQNTVNLINEVSRSCVAYFPINNSFIPLLIINQTMSFYLNRGELSLKSLYANINSSELGARNHITRLERKNWVSVEPSLLDKRVKVVKPTEKLIRSFELVADALTVVDVSECCDCPLKSERGR